MIRMIQAPRANLATAKMMVTVPVATAPMPLTIALRRQPGPRSARQWWTMPACERVNDVNTPMA